MKKKKKKERRTKLIFLRSDFFIPTKVSETLGAVLHE